nr:MAG TPA: hypothetical protein [Caudoviricetes sp.]
MPTTNQLKQYARQMAQKYGIDPELFVRQIQIESGFNPRAKSSAGAVGIAQFMPFTAKGMGFTAGVNPLRDLEMAAKLMAGHLRNNNGRYDLALAAYNAGQGNVNKHGGVPPFKETQNYVRNILGNNKRIKTKEILAQVSTNQQPLQGQIQQGNLSYPQGIERIQNLQLPNPQTMRNPELEQRAIQGMSDFKAALDMFRRGLRSYQELAVQFPNEVAQTGITPEMQGSFLPQDVRDIMNEAAAVRPSNADIEIANQRVSQQNKEIRDTVAQREQALRDFMQQQYLAQRQDIANNPTLQRGGYYIDPDTAVNSLMGDTVLGIVNNKPEMIKGYEDAVRARYQADIANQYGIPYDQLVAAQDAVYKNTVEAAKQNMQNAIIMYQRGDMTTAELMKAMQTNQAAVNGMQQGANEKYLEFLGKVVPNMVTQAGGIQRAGINAQSDINRQAGVNAANLANNYANANYGLYGQVYGNLTDTNIAEAQMLARKYGYDLNNMTQQDWIAVAKAKQDEDTRRYEQDRNINNFYKTATGLGAASQVYNLDPVALANQTGVTINQDATQIRPTARTNQSLTPSGLFQGLIPQVQSRNQMLEQEMQNNGVIY